MRIVAKFPVELGGHICRAGEAIEYDGPLTERIRANFAVADGGQDAESGGGQGQADAEASGGQPTGDARHGADERALVARTLRKLGRDGLARQLDDMGVTYPAGAKGEYLARLLLVCKGELREM